MQPHPRPPVIKEFNAIERSLDRMLYALRDYFEHLSGERLPEQLREYWMSPTRDPRDTVSTRKAMLAAVDPDEKAAKHQAEPA